MAEIIAPDYSLIWASSGDVLQPSSTKIQQGWQPEIPPRQWFNWLDNRQDVAIASILQHGLPVWSSTLEYQAGKSFVQASDGRIYVAVVTNLNQDPSVDTTQTYWTPILTQRVSVITSTSTWTVPYILRSGLRTAHVMVQAGGGGGGASVNGNAGSGGGGGGLGEALVNLTGVNTVSITVGLGGNAGLAGGSTSFGSFCSATGGSGATGLATPVPGQGGTSSGGSLFRANTLGSGQQRQLQGGGLVTSGRGGGDGGGGQIEAGAGVVLPGNSATAWGCGGGGGVNGGTGGSGAPGIVIIRW
jgi:hypothetical protein